ncbi:unnamed protein product [Didymodactylos carnosus]|uniref:SWIM-type domain-containing protein n=1 Tax=Didymodactylos carnosus TaxID=1234261 RepID=A0A815ZMB2_9BILA|nr:unnamed protein product [Didymodactylos carnosus]CAF4456429.1 unnamed protein product [Didymodactylos carnosus]
MLGDWSKHCETNPFSVSTSITPDCELAGYKWSTTIDRNSILYWYDDFYVVPSSNAHKTPSTWLDLYRSRQWLTFNDFLIWQQSCWLVAPLKSCSCPIGMKQYSCKHSVGLAILFNLYQVSDKTRIQPLGKRKTKGRPKKVSTALKL